MAKQVLESRFGLVDKDQIDEQDNPYAVIEGAPTDLGSKRLLTLAFVTETALDESFFEPLYREFMRRSKGETLTLDHVIINASSTPSSSQKLDAYPLWTILANPEEPKESQILLTKFLVEATHIDDASQNWRDVVVRTLADYTLDRHEWALDNDHYSGLGSESPWLDHIVYVDKAMLAKLDMTVQQLRYAMHAQVTDAYLVLEWDGTVEQPKSMIKDRRRRKTFIATGLSRFTGWSYAMTQMAHNTNEQKVDMEDLIAIARIFRRFNDNDQLTKLAKDTDDREDQLEKRSKIIAESILGQVRDLGATQEQVDQAEELLAAIFKDPGQVAAFKNFVSTQFNVNIVDQVEQLERAQKRVTDIENEILRINKTIQELTNGIQTTESLLRQRDIEERLKTKLEQQSQAKNDEIQDLEEQAEALREQATKLDAELQEQSRMGQAKLDEINSLVAEISSLSDVIQCDDGLLRFLNRKDVQDIEKRIENLQEDLQDDNLTDEKRAKKERQLRNAEASRYRESSTGLQNRLRRAREAFDQVEAERKALLPDIDPDIETRRQEAIENLACHVGVIDPYFYTFRQEYEKQEAQNAADTEELRLSIDALVEQITELDPDIEKKTLEKQEIDNKKEEATREFNQTEDRLNSVGPNYSPFEPQGGGRIPLDEAKDALKDQEARRSQLVLNDLPDAEAAVIIIQESLDKLNERTELLLTIQNNAEQLARVAAQEIDAEEQVKEVNRNLQQTMAEHAMPVIDLAQVWLQDLFDGLVNETPMSQRFEPTNTELAYGLVIQFPKLREYQSVETWFDERVGKIRFFDTEEPEDVFEDAEDQI